MCIGHCALVSSVRRIQPVLEPASKDLVAMDRAGNPVDSEDAECFSVSGVGESF